MLGSTACAATLPSSAAPSAAPPRAPAKPSGAARAGSSMSRAGSTKNLNPPRSAASPAPCAPPEAADRLPGTCWQRMGNCLRTRHITDRQNREPARFGPALCLLRKVIDGQCGGRIRSMTEIVVVRDCRGVPVHVCRPDARLAQGSLFFWPVELHGVFFRYGWDLIHDRHAIVDQFSKSNYLIG